MIRPAIFRFTATCLTALVVIGAVSMLIFETVSAGPVVGFKPGRIIDDSIFSNVNTMSAGQIQGFLNSKVPTCDTQGTQPSEFGGGTRAQYGRANGNPPPFICLKDYRENNKPAAQIIREVAVQYQINPQVLIVLLQKEQGLVTDTWPWKSQYRSATGYGCPDTAPCDRDYYGFTNQVRWAAKMFRAILNDDPEWYTRYNVGANRIQYNPNSSCGSSMVNVENRATAALYNYTPYQPNAAALQAGYGQGNSCSAYGNRNFYLYFTDWFGATTTLFTPFFTITGRDGIFITGANNSYYQVRSTAQLKDYGYGSRFHRLDNITSAAANNRTFKGYLPTVARFEGDAIYVINEARKHQFTSASQYSAYGFSMGQEATLPETLAPNYALSANMQSVLTQSDRQEIYFIEGGKKRHISSREAYQTMGSPTYASLPTVELSSRFAASMSDGRPIVVASSLVESYDTDDFHWWNGSQRQAVANTLVLGAEKTSDYAAPANVVEQLPASSSPTITAYVKDSSNNYFLISAKHKIALDSAAMTKLGVPTGSYTLTDGAFLALFPTVNPTALPVRVNNGTKVYLYKNNVFRHIYSKEDLESYGFNLDQTITLTTDAAKLYSISSEPLLAEGKLIQIGSGDDIYMISNESKHKLPSPSFFALFGRNTREIRSVPASVAMQYTTGQPLSYWHKGVDGKAWLFQNGRRYLASTTMLSAAHYDKPSASLQALSNPVIGKVPSGQDLAELLRFGTEDTVYAIRDGKKSVVTSRDAFTREFGDQKWSQILSVGQDMLRRIPNGPPIQ